MGRGDQINKAALHGTDRSAFPMASAMSKRRPLGGASLVLTEDAVLPAWLLLMYQTCTGTPAGPGHVSENHNMGTF